MKPRMTIEQYRAWMEQWRAGRLRRYTSGYQELYETATMYAGDGDVWGWGMSWFFATAHVLHHMTDTDIPAEWQYRHGIGCDGTRWRDDAETDEAASLYESGIVTDADLIAFGDVINRYLDWCRMAGRDY